MITVEALKEHKRKFPDFDYGRMICWLEENHRWGDFKSVTDANRARKSEAKLTRWVESMD